MFAVGHSDLKILAAIRRYHYISAEQLCRLLYASGSLTYVQERLTPLVHNRYVQRLFLPRFSQHGSSPSLYRLAAKGIAHLSSAGLEVPKRYRATERAHSYLFLSHTLAVNDVLISGELLSRHSTPVSLRRLVHERDLHHDPVKFEDSEGRKREVRFDGFLDFELAGDYQVCLALEVDNGTEEQRQFRDKIRRLVACSDGAYQKRFDTDSLTFAVVAVPGERRCRELLQWAEAELTELGTHVADLFRFTSGSARLVSPDDFYLGPRWYRPFLPEPVPLVDA